MNDLLQMRGLFTASELVDWRGEFAVEVLARAEQSRIDKAELRKEVRCVVLNRRSTEYDPVNGPELKHRPCYSGVGILDRLAFIQNDILPKEIGELLHVIPDYPIRCKHEVVFLEMGFAEFPLQAVMCVEAEARAEFLYFILPVEDQGCGADDELGATGVFFLYVLNE